MVLWLLWSLQVLIGDGFAFLYQRKTSDKIPIKFSRLKNIFLLSLSVFFSKKIILCSAHADALSFWWRAHEID
tara:strand:+ start:473 stop:691 length:219 start_codon:yes stop_codon:yes gene_type:complete